LAVSKNHISISANVTIKSDTLHNFANKTANISNKNRSLSIMLTAMDQKPEKSLKR